jgi:hypothetical protein
MRKKKPAKKTSSQRKKAIHSSSQNPVQSKKPARSKDASARIHQGVGQATTGTEDSSSEM